MSYRKPKVSNKKKGDGNGHSVIDNHEYTSKASTTSSKSSSSLNDDVSVKKNKKEK